ncbi:DUF86 domain-containing protein [bacterium]|nr:DUF86 domain-containing protein [bacterium]MBU1638262.1 DUF86 domain-containing protein [bacterium]
MPRDEGYLLSMLIAARRVMRSVTGVTYDQFRENLEKQDSVILQIGNIGEAANHVSKEFRDKHPNIQWKDIINMRHRMVHGYDLIKLEEVWKAANLSVSELIKLIEPLIPPDEG